MECPKCGELHEDWHRASINLLLDGFGDAYADRAASVTCPACGHRVEIDVLVIDVDDTWRRI